MGLISEISRTDEVNKLEKQNAELKDTLKIIWEYLAAQQQADSVRDLIITVLAKADMEKKL